MSVWDDLINESKRLEEETGKIQNGKKIGLSKEEIDKLSHDYQTWLAKCLLLLPEDLKEKFRAAYEGTFWNAKIKKFLDAATETSPFYTDDPNAKDFIPYWSFPYTQNFLPNIRSQRQMLIEASQRSPNTDEPTKDDKCKSWNKTVRRIFKVFIEKAENASTTNEKKLSYEYLAIFLIGAINGLTVIGHDKRGVSEEIDLWVTNTSTNTFWQRMPDAFIVECKNWGNPVGAPEVRNLTAIMSDKKIRFAILMTKNGVTGDKNHDSGDIIRNAFRDNKCIIVLTHADLLEIASGVTPTKKIQEKYYELIMKS